MVLKEVIVIMDLNHYKIIKCNSLSAYYYAQNNNLDLDLIGASPQLIDININELYSINHINFIDSDDSILMTIKENLHVEVLKKSSFVNINITDKSCVIRNKITKIFKISTTSNDAISQIINYISNLSLQTIKDEYKNKVLISLNVISELTLDLQKYCEQLNYFFYHNSIKNSVSKSIYDNYNNAFHKYHYYCFSNHIINGINFAYFSCFITINEGNKSYISADIINPNDRNAQKALYDIHNSLVLRDVWNWHIAENRTIRMGYIENCYY